MSHPYSKASAGVYDAGAALLIIVVVPQPTSPTGAASGEKGHSRSGGTPDRDRDEILAFSACRSAIQFPCHGEADLQADSRGLAHQRSGPPSPVPSIYLRGVETSMSGADRAGLSPRARQVGRRWRTGSPKAEEVSGRPTGLEPRRRRNAIRLFRYRDPGSTAYTSPVAWVLSAWRARTGQVECRAYMPGLGGTAIRRLSGRAPRSRPYSR